MTITPLVYPSGYGGYGASAPEPVLSADETTFYGMDSLLGKEWRGYVVYHQAPGSAPATVVLEILGAGQGSLTLQPDGSLWATAYRGPGDKQPVVPMKIAEYVPFAPPATTAEDAEARRLARAALDQNVNQRKMLDTLDARADTLDRQVAVLDERVDALAQG